MLYGNIHSLYKKMGGMIMFNIDKLVDEFLYKIAEDIYESDLSDEQAREHLTLLNDVIKKLIEGDL